MPLLRPAHLAAGAALAGLAAAPAHAAYAPKLSVSLSPSTPRATPAITSTITQAAGETANKTVRVSFPAAFSIPSTPPVIGVCSAAQEQARSCPAESQIGTADAVATVLLLPVSLTGGVYYGGPVGTRIKLIVFLDNASLNQHQTIEGFVEIRPSDHGFDTVFDGLPNVPTTSFRLALAGGTKSLVSTPKQCGDYAFTAQFTSQSGEQATSTSPVKIAPCASTAPSLTRLSLSPARPRAGRGTTLTFRLDSAAQVHVTVSPAGGGRRVADLRFTGRVGTNRVRRLARRARPGRYRVTVAVRAPSGLTSIRRATLIVRR